MGQHPGQNFALITRPRECHLFFRTKNTEKTEITEKNKDKMGYESLGSNFRWTFKGKKLDQ